MNSFQKTALATLFATLALISIGSLVRVAGAGLGCPDWPKCWGTWIPPTSADALDLVYLREKGYDPASFSLAKMWIEYVNRLVGVVIGILIFATFLRSISYRKTRPILLYGSGFALVLVAFQGWLGGQVVRSGLQPGIITLHMGLAVLLLCNLLYVTYESIEQRTALRLPSQLRSKQLHASIVLLAFTIIQVLLGAQVREAIDPFIKDDAGLGRGEWLGQVGFIDHAHRISSWLVLIAGGWLWYIIGRLEHARMLKRISRFVLAGIVLQIILGVILAYGGLPRPAQVLHLVLAALLICAECLLLLVIRNSEEISDIVRSPAGMQDRV